MGLQFCPAFTASVALVLRTKKVAGQWLSLSGICFIGLVLFLNFPSWNRQLLSFGRYRNFKEVENHLTDASWLDALYLGSTILAGCEITSEIVFYGDGIGGFTTVQKQTDSLGTVEDSLLNSGKPDASTHGDRSTQTLLAHVPLLFHPTPKNVMVLGLASGMTAREVLHYPVKQLDVLEINEQVVKACEIFAPCNNDCLEDPRTRTIVQDGRNHLALTRETYDVIISEPSNSWMAGLANPCTLEFFQAVKDRLREDGIFVQWIHSYEMDWPTFALAGRTFTEVFPDSLLMTTVPPDYLLVGFSGRKGFNLEVAEKNITYAQRSRNISLPDPRLLFHLIITEDPKKLFGPGPLHTDNWPHLEFAAPKQLYGSAVPIAERINERRWRSPQTKEIIEASRHMDSLLDMVEFSASVGSPSFAILDPDEATLSQKERYLGIVKGYCNQVLVPDYKIFPDQGVKVQCARLLAVKIRQHLALNPTDVHAYCDLGRALVQMGKPEEAIAHYSQALQIRPGFARAHYYLGIALGVQGRLDEAIGHFSEALRIKSDYVEAKKRLEAVLRLMGKSTETQNTVVRP